LQHDPIIPNHFFSDSFSFSSMAIRLHLIFFVVLGVSVIGTSLAAWAITFASSHYRPSVPLSVITKLEK